MWDNKGSRIQKESVLVPSTVRETAREYARPPAHWSVIGTCSDFTRHTMVGIGKRSEFRLMAGFTAAADAAVMRASIFTRVECFTERLLSQVVFYSFGNRMERTNGGLRKVRNAGVECGVVKSGSGLPHSKTWRRILRAWMQYVPAE